MRHANFTPSLNSSPLMHSKHDRFKTILVIVTGLLALSVFFEVKLLAIAALTLGLVAVFIPLAARVIEWLWMKLALMLGWTNSKILLGIIYFGFLMPLAMVSRLFTKDPLSIKARDTSTLFVERNHSYKKDDLTNIW
jgi:hypothetical protein